MPDVPDDSVLGLIEHKVERHRELDDTQAAQDNKTQRLDESRKRKEKRKNDETNRAKVVEATLRRGYIRQQLRKLSSCLPGAQVTAGL